MENPEKIYIALLIVVGIGMAYMVYLDSGCKVGGVMTSQGKVCVEQIIN